MKKIWFWMWPTDVSPNQLPFFWHSPHFPNLFYGLKLSGFTSVWSVSHADKHRLRLRHFSLTENKEIDFDLHLYCVPTVYQPLKALSSTCHIHPCTLTSQSLVGETSGGLLNRSRHHSPPQSHDHGNAFTGNLKFIQIPPSLAKNTLCMLEVRLTGISLQNVHTIIRLHEWASWRE